MKRIQIAVSVVGVTITLSTVSIVQADAPEEGFAAALASAPPGVRDLRCQDVASLSGTDLVDFRNWFEQFMTAVAHIGMSADEMYRQLLSDCARNQSWSAVDAALQLRQLMQ